VRAAQEIKKAGGEAWAYHCNVMDNEAVRQVATAVQSEVGKVDILINNAGIVSGKFITDLSDEHITRTMGVNVLSHFWTIKAFLPAMISSNRGHIVTVGTTALFSLSS
jgi:all-trans-retinol dehydrogenase (NAD+)